MDIIEQERHFDTLVAKCKKIMLSKGNDYAGEDRLSNFNKVAEIVGITPAQVILVFKATKLIREVQLLKSGKGAENESLADSFIDDVNYTILCDMILAKAIPARPAFNPVRNLPK